MKISGNFALIGNNSRYTNTYNSNNNHPTYNTGLYQSDSVSFTGRPKSLKRLEKAIQQSMEEADRLLKTGRGRAQNHIMGEFKQETQIQLRNLRENADAIEKFFDNLGKTNPTKVIKLKQDYKPLVYIPNKQSLTFRMENGKALTVKKNRNMPEIVRLTVVDEDKPYHFLLSGTNKAIANVVQCCPSQLPRQIRYMSAQEIADSGVENYIRFASKSLEDFGKYLSESTTNL